MTLIEFFDKCAIDNILGALVCEPERVVFIGDSTKQMNRRMDAYRQILSSRGKKTELICKGVNKNDLLSIAQTLSQIVEQEESCVFNLDGGEELYLVAVGMVAQHYPEKVKLQRFNLRSSTIAECDTSGCTRRSVPLAVTVAETAMLYGGKVVYEEEKSGATYHWNFTEEFCRDIWAMWRVCSENPKAWNLQLGILDKLDSLFPLDDQRLTVPMEEARTQIQKRRAKESDFFRLLESLAKEGLLQEYRRSDRQFSFRYKDHQVRRCLTKAGQILELMIAAAAMEAEADGEKLYHDVATGVYLDWDGDLEEYGADTSNEIDVLLMKGAIPVFISCKNGSVETEELYKLNTVARRFGGAYAKRVLVASELEKMGSKADYLRERAKDMGIRIVENVDQMTQQELKKQIAALWQ